MSLNPEEKVLSSSPNMRYVYIRPDKTSKGPVVSIGYCINDKKELLATAAFCSPQDRFCKKTARNIINGRMNANKYIIINNGYDREPKYQDAVDELVTHLTRKSWRWGKAVTIPSWFYKIDFFTT